MAEQSAYQCEQCGVFSYTLDALLMHNCTTSIGAPFDVGGLPKQPDKQADTEVPLDRWEDKEVRPLISCYSDNKHLFNNRGKKTKKEIFKTITDGFNTVSDKHVTVDQCMRKWTRLETKYKEVEDHNKKTGNERKNWKFLKEMNDCLKSNPKINPAYTIESSSSKSTSTPPEDLSDTPDSSDEIERKVKRPTRKRKSKSSAAEMLDFLHSYTERREKTEAEKLELLKSMKDEKKEFYSQFLDVLKQK